MDQEFAKKMEENWTPRQRIYWESNPEKLSWVREMFDRFQAEPVKSEEVRRGEKIAERVGSWIDQVALSPKEARVVERDPISVEAASAEVMAVMRRIDGRFNLWRGST